MKRTKLADRNLPNYTKGEEIMNMVTHIVGGGLGIIALLLCTIKSIATISTLKTIGSIIYGVSLISLYTMSSIYHGLHPGTGKKVLQILDHCMIYFLIAGTYSVILLSSIIPFFRWQGIFLFVFQWGLGGLAATLTAIDLKKYNIMSMICYFLMGWSMALFFPQAYYAIGHSGLLLIFWGGIAYTAGAILFAIGAKIHWFHSVFHIFVLLGSIIQFIGIYQYVL